jgi:ribosome-associated protein
VSGQEDDFAADAARPPSKSARKRAAHAVQDLGEQLISLNETELAALDLPEVLREAIRDARRISARGGAARQRQYIGKLMREIDPEPIRATLSARSEQQSREAQLFKRVEAWRDRLLREGAAALDELQRWRPEIDRAHWETLVMAAQAERSDNRTPAAVAAGAGAKAARLLFRALRELLAGNPEPAPPGTMPR